MRWANEHPEQMEEIARLPMREQNAALRAAIGYDPDAIRDQERERIHHHRPLNTSAGEDVGTPPAGSPSPAEEFCDVCGAPRDEQCAWYCMGEQIS